MPTAPAPSAAALRIAPVRFSPTLFAPALGAIWTVNHPGRIGRDSLEQLIGAAFPAYRNDWHNPIVAWLWNLPAPLLGQPAAALLVQSLLVAFGVAVVPARLPRNGRAAAALALEACWKGALIALAGAISKDVLLAGVLIAALGAFQLWLDRRRRGWLLLFAIFFLFAALVRPPNFLMFSVAAALALPLFSDGPRRYAKRLLLVSAVLLAFVPLLGWANGHLFRARPVHPEAQLILFDIAGTSVRSGTDLFRAMPGWPAPPLPDLGGCYNPAAWDNLAPWGRCRDYTFATRTAVSRIGGMRFATWWLSALAAHPLAYAEHRLDYMGHALRSGSFRPSRISVLGGQQAFNEPANEAALRAAVQGRIPLSHFQPWHDDTMPWPLAILAALVVWLPGLSGLALLICLAVEAASLRLWLRRRPVDPVAAAAAALGIGNVALMLAFGAATAPNYFLPLLLGAYVAVTSLLRGPPVRPAE